MILAKKHTTESLWIPSTGRNIRLLIVHPTQAAKCPDQTPGILWIHGGGHFLGSPEMVFISRARRLVEEYGAVVVSPAYRIAPEAPFPAALEDCYAALLYLKTYAAELGINDSQIMVGGESAGGGLAAATCLLARDLGDVNVAFQMPLYPMLDDRDTPSSRNNHAPIWNTKWNHLGWRTYLRGLKRSDQTPLNTPPYAAPARETNYAGLPPAYTFVGNIEPFYCEAIDYITNLQQAGIEATIDIYPRWFHAYDMLLPHANMSKLAIQRFEAHYLHAVEHYFAPQD